MKELFDRQVRDWQRRKRRMGDGAVGRLGERHTEQGARIAGRLEPLLDGFHRHGLDFGCGWGRFSELLAGCCGHLWSVDIFEDWTARAAAASPTITPVTLQEPKLPIGARSIDLVVDIMTIQSIKDDGLMLTFCNELRRVTTKDARIVSLHFVKPELPNRTAAHRAKQLGLSKWNEIRATDIDNAGDPYSLLVGARVG